LRRHPSADVIEEIARYGKHERLVRMMISQQAK